MRISDMLYAIASWLENPDNEALLLAENDEDCLNVVASSCVEAAALLKITAETVDMIEPPEESKLTSESIEGLAQIAEAFDNSGDEGLIKQAAVIDELLMTIAAPEDSVARAKSMADSRIEALKKCYQESGKYLEEKNKVSESQKAIDQSGMTKQYRILEHPLSTRTCPDHPGAQISRVGDNLYQCDLDKKVYDFENGFTLADGSKVPGGNVSNQTKGLDLPSFSLFDTREERLQTNKA